MISIFFLITRITQISPILINIFVFTS
uniref:Uncharacterized protein n=1 Tax=Arundo donax TaxID=35708 RepID=A0A0A8Y618_ARUDO